MLIMNPTQWIGIVSFILAGLSGWIAGKHSENRMWQWSSAAYGVLAVEVAMGFRHQLQGVLRSITMEQGFYDIRRSYQPILIIVMLLANVLIFYWLLRIQWRTNPIFGVYVSLLFISALFLMEIVSLHAVDAVLYRRVGSILLIGWLWALAVVPHVTCAGWQIASARLTRRRG
jgi:hypothetical protein